MLKFSIEFFFLTITVPCFRIAFHPAYSLNASNLWLFWRLAEDLNSFLVIYLNFNYPLSFLFLLSPIFMQYSFLVEKVISLPVELGLGIFSVLKHFVETTEFIIVRSNILCSYRLWESLLNFKNLHNSLAHWILWSVSDR